MGLSSPLGLKNLRLVEDSCYSPYVFSSQLD
jgi:hypothetical protein